MEAEDIERYLAELGTELKNRGLNKQAQPRCRLVELSGSDADVRRSDRA